GQQAADEIDARLLRRLLAGGRAEALPEAALRPLLAGAEQRPPDAALVVLGAREGQRTQEDETLVGQVAGLLREAERPVGVVDELLGRDAVAGPAAGQAGEGLDELTADLLQAGPQRQRLLVLRDAPAPRVVVGERQRLAARVRVRLEAEARRRHELGVR